MLSVGAQAGTDFTVRRADVSRRVVEGAQAGTWCGQLQVCVVQQGSVAPANAPRPFNRPKPKYVTFCNNFATARSPGGQKAADHAHSSQPNVQITP